MARQRQTVGSNFAKPWKPTEAGESIEGVFSGHNFVKGDRGESFKSFKIKPEGQEEYIGVAGAMLDSMLSRVPVGSYVWITFKGTLKTNNGMAKDFSVECEKGVKLLEITSDSPVEDSDNY